MTKKMFSKKMALTAAACAAALALTAVPAASAATCVDETEPNNLIGNATPVKVGDTLCGVLDSNESNDWFKINTPVAGQYTLDFYSNNPAGYYQKVTLYDNSRNEIYYILPHTSNYSRNWIRATLPAGVAYVQVSREYNNDNDWQYELKLNYNPSTPALHAPKTTKTTLSASWSKVSNATGYQVKVGGKTYKTSSNKIKVTGLKSKKTKSVMVRAYSTLDGNTFYGDWSATRTVRTK